MVEKKNFKKIFLILGVIFSIVVLIAIITLLLMHKSPKEEFISIINNNGKNVLKTINNTKELNSVLNYINNKENLEFELDGKLSINMDDIKVEDKYYINGIKNKDNVIKANYKFNSDNKDLFKGTYVIEKDKLYFKLDGFDNYYYSKLELPIININQSNSIDLNKLISKLIEALPKVFNKAIVDDDIKISDEVIKVNNEDINAKRYSIEIDDDLMTRITNEFKEYLKNDEELLSILKNIEDSSEEEILNNIVKDDDSYKSDEKININIYVKDNKLVLFDIGDDENSFSISDYNDVFELSLSNDTSLSLIVKKESDNNYNIEFKKDNQSVIFGSIEINNENIKYDLVLSNDLFQKIRIFGNNSISNENDEYNINGKINFEMDIIYYKYNISFEYNGILKESNGYIESDYKNAKTIDKLSKNDEEILNNIENNIYFSDNILNYN